MNLLVDPSQQISLLSSNNSNNNSTIISPYLVNHCLIGSVGGGVKQPTIYADHYDLSQWTGKFLFIFFL